MTDIEKLKADVAVLTDGKLDQADVAAVRRMARTVPNLIVSLLALVVAGAALFGLELEAQPDPAPAPAEGETDTE